MAVGACQTRIAWALRRWDGLIFGKLRTMRALPEGKLHSASLPPMPHFLYLSLAAKRLWTHRCVKGSFWWQVMAGLKDTRDRIASVKSTQKITDAMKLVAAAKVRRAQEAVVNGRPFAENLVKVGTASSTPLAAMCRSVLSLLAAGGPRDCCSLGMVHARCCMA